MDCSGIRRSEMHASFEDAEIALHAYKLENAEVRRGLRSPVLTRRTFADLCDYWRDARAPRKRSGACYFPIPAPCTRKAGRSIMA